MLSFTPLSTIDTAVGDLLIGNTRTSVNARERDPWLLSVENMYCTGKGYVSIASAMFKHS